jgi:hypothetical protein
MTIANPDLPAGPNRREGECGPPIVPPRPFDADRKHTYVRALARTGTHAQAARIAGVGPTTVSKHRSPGSELYDPEFVAEIDHALELFRARLHREALRRGAKGVKEPIYSRGRLVGHRKVFSDRLLELLLKRHDPAFKDGPLVDQRSVQVAPAFDVDDFTPEEQERLALLLQEVSNRRAASPPPSPSTPTGPAAPPTSPSPPAPEPPP